jgi:deazaflavin-dependent oxidoreductase (nitroreductase family)
VTSIESLAETEYCYLTTTGRRSGRAHRIEIWFVAHDDGAYLLQNTAGADWYRNIVADPAVELEIAGERRSTTARPVERSDPAGALVRPSMVAKYQAGYPHEDLTDWSETAVLVRVEWPARGA